MTFFKDLMNVTHFQVTGAPFWSGDCCYGSGRRN